MANAPIRSKLLKTMTVMGDIPLDSTYTKRYIKKITQPVQLYHSKGSKKIVIIIRNKTPNNRKTYRIYEYSKLSSKLDDTNYTRDIGKSYSDPGGGVKWKAQSKVYECKSVYSTRNKSCQFADRLNNLQKDKAECANTRNLFTSCSDPYVNFNKMNRRTYEGQHVLSTKNKSCQFGELVPMLLQSDVLERCCSGEIFKSRSDSSVLLHKRNRRRVNETKSVISIRNKSCQFEDVNVATTPPSTKSLCQKKYKVYRCQLSNEEDSCCCKCNSDNMFEVMKSLYDCYKSKNCDNCNCILCGHVPVEERRLGEMRKAAIAKAKTSVLKGKSSAEKQKLRDAATQGSPLPEPLTPSEKDMLKKVTTDMLEKPYKGKVSSEKLRKAKAAGVLTPLEGKTSKQKEAILKGLATYGIPLPEPQTSSMRKLTNKVRADLGLPPEPKTDAERSKYKKALAAGVITPLEGKTDEEKEKVLKKWQQMGIELPEGKTPSEKEMINKIKKPPQVEKKTETKKVDLTTKSVTKVASDEKTIDKKVQSDIKMLPYKGKVSSTRLRKAKAAGLLTPLEGKTAKQRERILKGLATHDIPMPEATTPSMKKVMNKVRADIGLPPEPKTEAEKEKYNKAMTLGLITPLEGKTRQEKEKILKKMIGIGIQLPEGRTPTEKQMILNLKKPTSTEKRLAIRSKFDDMSPEDKEKYLRGLAAKGLPMLEPKTSTDRELVKKIQEEIKGLPEKGKVASAQQQKAMASGLLTPLKGKTPKQQVRILKSMAMHDIPLPEATSPSMKVIIDKVRADLGLPPEPKSQSERDRYNKAMAAGAITPLEGKSPDEQAKILNRMHKLGIPLPEGRTPAEKEIVLNIQKPQSAAPRTAPETKVVVRHPSVERRPTRPPAEMKVIVHHPSVERGVQPKPPPEMKVVVHHPPVERPQPRPETKIVLQHPSVERGIQPRPPPEMKVIVHHPPEEKIQPRPQPEMKIVVHHPPGEEQIQPRQQQVIVVHHPGEEQIPQKQQPIVVVHHPPGQEQTQPRPQQPLVVVHHPPAEERIQQKQQPIVVVHHPPGEERIQPRPQPEMKVVVHHPSVDRGTQPKPPPQTNIVLHPGERDVQPKPPPEMNIVVHHPPREKRVRPKTDVVHLPYEGKVSSNKIRKAKAAGLWTPFEGKTDKQKEQMLKGLTVLGFPFPEAKTPSSRKMQQKLRLELGLPPAPTTGAETDRYKKAMNAGMITPLEGKSNDEKEKILKNMMKFGIPLPEGRTPSEKAIILNLKRSPTTEKRPSMKVKFDDMTPQDKERYLRAQAAKGLPLIEPKTASDRELVKKIQLEIKGLPQKGETSSEKLRKAKEEGLLTPLEGKTPKQQVDILKGMAMKNIPLPEATTSSMKIIINKVRADLGLPPQPNTDAEKEKYNRALNAGAIVPLEGKSQNEKVKILKNAMKFGIELPEGRTPSEKSIINKLKKPSLTVEGKSKDLKQKYPKEPEAKRVSMLEPQTVPEKEDVKKGKSYVKELPHQRKALSEKLQKAKTAGRFTPLEGKTPKQKEKIAKELTARGVPIQEPKSVSMKKKIEKERKDLGLPPEPKTEDKKEKYKKAMKAGIITPLEGKSKKEKENILKNLLKAGVDLPEGRTPSEKELITKIKKSPTTTKEADVKRLPAEKKPTSERMRQAKARGLLTPLVGKTARQQEEILKGLAALGIPLPEGKTPSTKKMLEKVRTDVGLPPEPKTDVQREVYNKALAAGAIVPLEGKTKDEKENILNKMAEMGVTLPEGRTLSEKELVKKVKESFTATKAKSKKLSVEKRPTAADKGLSEKTARKVAKISKTASSRRIASSKLKEAMAAGLITPLATKTSEQKKEILKGLALKNIPLPEPRTGSDKKLVETVRRDLGLPPGPHNSADKTKYNEAIAKGLIQPLEGKTNAEKEVILKQIADLGLKLPEGRTSSEKELIKKVKAQQEPAITSSIEDKKKEQLQADVCECDKVKPEKKAIGIDASEKESRSVGVVLKKTLTENIKKSSKCDAACGCEMKKIRFKHSYVKIKVISPDLSNICPCPEDCYPRVKSEVTGNMTDGLQVTVGRQLGTPVFVGGLHSVYSVTSLESVQSVTILRRTKGCEDGMDCLLKQWMLSDRDSEVVQGSVSSNKDKGAHPLHFKSYYIPTSNDTIHSSVSNRECAEDVGAVSVVSRYGPLKRVDSKVMLNNDSTLCLRKSSSTTSIVSFIGSEHSVPYSFNSSPNLGHMRQKLEIFKNEEYTFRDYLNRINSTEVSNGSFGGVRMVRVSRSASGRNAFANTSSTSEETTGSTYSSRCERDIRTVVEDVLSKQSSCSLRDDSSIFALVSCSGNSMTHSSAINSSEINFVTEYAVKSQRRKRKTREKPRKQKKECNKSRPKRRFKNKATSFNSMLPITVTHKGISCSSFENNDKVQKRDRKSCPSEYCRVPMPSRSLTQTSEDRRVSLYGEYDPRQSHMRQLKLEQINKVLNVMDDNDESATTHDSNMYSNVNVNVCDIEKIDKIIELLHSKSKQPIKRCAFKSGSIKTIVQQQEDMNDVYETWRHIISILCKNSDGNVTRRIRNKGNNSYYRNIDKILRILNKVPDKSKTYPVVSGCDNSNENGDNTTSKSNKNRKNTRNSICQYEQSKLPKGVEGCHNLLGSNHALQVSSVSTEHTSLDNDTQLSRHSISVFQKKIEQLGIAMRSLMAQEQTISANWSPISVLQETPRWTPVSLATPMSSGCVFSACRVHSLAGNSPEGKLNLARVLDNQYGSDSNGMIPLRVYAPSTYNVGDRHMLSRSQTASDIRGFKLSVHAKGSKHE